MRFSDMTHDEMLERLRLCECALSAAVKERDQANERAANLAVELAAMTLNRDQARQEAERLVRQIELVKPSLERMLCEDCPMGGDCVSLKINTDGSLTCCESIFRWAAQMAKEAT